MGLFVWEKNCWKSALLIISFINNAESAKKFLIKMNSASKLYNLVRLNISMLDVISQILDGV